VSKISTPRDCSKRKSPTKRKVGHSDRSKTPIEPYLSDQWFVKMAPLARAGAAGRARRDDQVLPRAPRAAVPDWLGEKRDWPISRQLWWGHRITVWSLREKITDPTSEQVEMVATWLRENVRLGHERTHGNSVPRRIVLCHSTNELTTRCATASSAFGDREARTRRCAQYFEERGFVQEPDVLDTWFS
jgi:valyl-tRNA synthetase